MSNEPDQLELQRLEEYLSKVPMFAGMAQTERFTLAKSFEKRRYQVDEDVVKQDSNGTEFYIVGKGELVVTVNDTAVAILSQGDYFGETGLVSEQKRNATISAEDPAMCFVLTKAKFEKLGMKIRGDALKAKGTRKMVTANARKVTSAQPEKKETQKNKKTVDILIKALRSNDNLKVLLGELARDQLDATVDRAWKMEVSEGDVVIEQGDEVADRFFLVESGAFEVFVTAKPGSTLEEKVQAVRSEGLQSTGFGSQAITGSKQSRKSQAPGSASQSISNKTLVAERGPGSSFGELALIQNAPRAATIQASSPGVVWVLDRHEFKQCLIEFAEKKADQYVALLKNVDLMKNLSPQELRAVSQECVEMHYDDGNKVIVEGEEGDTFYIIMAGRCDVYVGGANVKQMGVGDCFGERAILTKEKRAATIQVPADYGGATLLCLDQNSFEDTLGQKAFQRAKSKYMKIDLEEFEDEELENVIVAPSQLQVLGSIGESEFGFTKLVKDKDTKKTYALKTLDKTALVRVEYHEHALREKEVLSLCGNALFVQKMICSYRGAEHLNLVLLPCLGGNLHDIYSDEGTGLKGNEEKVKFHVACIALALHDVHTKAHAIHRDVRAENILLDNGGFALLGGFDLAKKTHCRTYTFCGAPECLAPEVVSLQTGYGRPVDWWALGVAMFEFMTGATPFANPNPMNVYKSIKAGHSKIEWPQNISPDMKTLMEGLLDSKPKERMGIKGKWTRFASQDWWNGFSWDQLKSYKMAAPWKPNLKGPEDLSCMKQSQEASSHTSHVIEASVAEGWDLAFGPTEKDLENNVAQQKKDGCQPPFRYLQNLDEEEATEAPGKEPGANGDSNGHSNGITPLNGIGPSADDTDPPALSEYINTQELPGATMPTLSSPRTNVPKSSFPLCCCSAE